MGRRGPKPTPTAVLELRGSKRARARRLAGEPTPAPAGELPLPSWLEGDDLVAATWRALAPQVLAVAGLIGDVDATAFEALVVVYARWRRAEEEIRREGAWYPVETREGSTVLREHPAVRQAKALLPELQRLLAAFGMTPAARAGLKVGAGGGEDGSKEAGRHPFVALPRSG